MNIHTHTYVKKKKITSAVPENMAKKFSESIVSVASAG